jgi:hypothetical protein
LSQYKPKFDIPKDVFRKPNPRKEDFLPPSGQTYGNKKMEIKNKSQSLPPLLPPGAATNPPQHLHYHPSVPIQNNLSIPSARGNNVGKVPYNLPNETTISHINNHNVTNHGSFHHQQHQEHRFMQNPKINNYDQRRKYLPNQNCNEEFELQPAPHYQRPQYGHGPHQ